MGNKLRLSLFLLLCGISFSLQTKTQNPHGNIKTPCAVCHTSDSWQIDTQKSPFKHDETGFRLTHAHKKAPCAACHRSSSFYKVGTRCADCHQDVHKGKMGVACETCHDNDRWASQKIQRNMIQSHQEAGFPLVGVHARIECSQCHANNQYRGTRSTCYDCHAKDYLATSAPNHGSLNIEKNCNKCHTALSWLKAFFSHNSFPLTGTHKSTPCSACHISGYSGTPNTCYGCHSADYNNTTNPKHASSGINTSCESCHSTTGWSVNHTFPINHKRSSCNDCHPSNYTTYSCLSCHNSSHTRSPSNADCMRCHPDGRKHD